MTENLPRTLDSAPFKKHRRWSIADLDELWSTVPASSGDRGRVAQVCVRPDIDQRFFPEVLELCPRHGAIGDRWERRTWMHLPDGSPDPRVQVAIANERVLRFLQKLTGCTHHPGDTLIVDLELSAHLVPIGARLRVGTAIIEVSDVENDACSKFAAHYGAEIVAWIRTPANRPKRLRGLFARVIEAGTVRNGDEIVALAMPRQSRENVGVMQHHECELARARSSV